MRSPCIISILLATVTFATMAQGKEGLMNIVNMGDSFASGVGARAQDGSMNYEGPFGCFRSPATWAAQYAESAGATTFVNVACASGVTGQVTTSRGFGTVSKWPWQGCPSSKWDDEYYTPNGKWSCKRHVMPQRDAIKNHTNPDSNMNPTDLVLLTMGANDVQFAVPAASCFVLLTMGEQRCRDALEKSFSMLAQVEEDMANALAAIGEYLDPRAKVVVFYYPLYVMDVGYKLGSIGPDADEQVRTLLAGLNQAVHNAATAGSRTNWVEARLDCTALDLTGIQRKTGRSGAHWYWQELRRY